MKPLFSLLFFVLFSQIAFAQTKVDEYEKTDSDSESIRIMDFVGNLRKEPESKGLIVIYSGENEKRLVDVLRHITGIKQYVERLYSNRIFFNIREGKKPLFKEFWIYPKDVAFPELEAKSINLDNLKSAYLYASICAVCEPQQLSLSSDFVDFDLYADLLKKYADYKGLIFITPSSQEGFGSKGFYKDALGYAVNYRNLLVKKYKINNKRIVIKIGKPTGKDAWAFAKFFIVPK